MLALPTVKYSYFVHVQLLYSNVISLDTFDIVSVPIRTPTILAVTRLISNLCFRDKLQLPASPVGGRGGGGGEEMPVDIRGFFGHPLVGGGGAVSSMEDGGQALLHEYQSLPAIGKLTNINDIILRYV